MISTALYNEIANTHLFEMQESAFFNHARMFLSHYRNLTDEEKNKTTDKNQFLLAASSGFNEKIYLGNAGRIASWEELDDTDVVINVVRLSGPMMRYGGGCAYGSVELRDMIMRAADVKQCVAQVFIVDTPGGSSATKNDLKEAMDYAHSKGQQTVMYVDGMVMSAGMAWAAMCKKRYSRNAHNLFGCMGTYASFHTNKNGDVNAITQEMFHTVYAEGSPNKNKPWRDAAEGDQNAIQEMVNKENDRYKEIIKQGIPNVTDEQLLGGEWEASEVIGTLCDGIRSFDEVINEILQARGLHVDSADGGPVFGHGSIDRWAQTAQGTEEPEKPEDEPEEPIEPEEPGDPNEPVDPNEPEEEPEKENSQNSINKLSKTMGKSYDKIKEALNWATLESGKDNSLWLHEDMADALTEFVESAEKTQNALEAKQADVNNLVAQIEQMKAEHTEALEAARKEASEEAAKTIQQMEDDTLALKEKVASLEAENQKLNETIAEKESAIKELAETTAPVAQPAVVQTKQVEEEKPLLASEFKNRKDAKEAHANLMQMLRERM